MNYERTITTSLVPHDAMAVDDAQAKALADRYIKHAGIGAFPKDLSPAEAGQLARIALAYGFDPLLGELTVYQHRPYITIDGRVRVAQNHPMFDGIEDLRPATEAERLAFRCDDDEYLWFARVWRKDRKFPFSAYGRARPARGRHEKGDSPEASHPQEVAGKRALHRALRMAFAIPLPGVEDEGADEGLRYESHPIIDQDTGEISGESWQEVEAERPPGIRDDQTRAIHALARALGWITNESDDLYRAMLQNTFGVISSVDLTEADASAIIDLLAAEQERQQQEAATEQARAAQTEHDERVKAELAAKGKRPADFASLPDDDPAPRLNPELLV